jgi:hypothetical protein
MPPFMKQKRENAKLTPMMIEALRRASEDGWHLVYVPGGWWTTSKTELCHGKLTPSWYVTTHTIKALESRGMLIVYRPMLDGHDWCRPRQVTQAGIDALERALAAAPAL